MADDVTPAQIASFDQAHAAVSASLDALLKCFRTSVANGEPMPLATVGQGEYLRDNFTHESLAEHLTVAIARLAEQPEDGAQIVPAGGDRG